MPPPKVFVVGGTGAQGIPVIRGLVKDGKYAVRALTRDPASPRAQHLQTLGPSGFVELVSGTFASEHDLRSGLNGCAYAFINLDGFNCGEKTETFWAIRTYELALESGIKFLVYGNLDYGYKKGGYDPKFRCGHYDGKGRVGEWILQQTKQNGKKMGAALFTTGPYIEMVLASGTPMAPVIQDGVVTWKVPLSDGAVPHVALDDCEHYVRWLFDHQDEANGMDLEVAIEHVNYHSMAKAFEEVSGHPARYEDVDRDTYWTISPLASRAGIPCGYNADPNDPSSMTVRQNFTGFWNLWRYSGANKGVVQRDYELLDRIHPGRVRSVRELFERENRRNERGLWGKVNNLRPVLKVAEDGGRGRL